MNDGRLSAATKALLAKARTDVPSGAARTNIWAGVSSAVGGAVGGAAATGAAAGPTSSASLAVGGGASAIKMLVLGTLLGGAVTVGLAATVIRLGSTPGTPVQTSEPATGAGAANRPATSPGSPALPVVQPERVESAHEPLPLTNVWAAPPIPPASLASPVVRSRSLPKVNPTDALAHEASLIAEARAALVRGDALAALRKARAARSMPTRQLVPEELAVEAQALRALGREVEATGVDKALRSRYPDSALAR